MAKNDLTRQQKEVLGILADNPQGVDIGQITQSLQAPPHKRTVQRWLTALAAEGHISVVGKGRATLYRLPAAGSGQRYRLVTLTDDKPREDYERVLKRPWNNLAKLNS